MSSLPFVLRRLPASLSEKFFYRYLCGRAFAKDKSITVDLKFYDQLVSFTVVPGDVIGDSLYYIGFYERKTTKELVSIASRDGGLFVDVGANIGYYSVLWTKAKKENRCIAIEASPRNIDLLRSNLELNCVTQSCEVLPIAASNQGGMVSFDQGPESQTGWGGISHGVGSGSRVIEVRCMPLDDILPVGRPIRLLKIDVEGAEALVLEGMQRLLSTRQVQEIWFEDNSERREMLGLSFESVINALETNAYCVFRNSAKSRLPMDFVALPHRLIGSE